MPTLSEAANYLETTNTTDIATRMVAYNHYFGYIQKPIKDYFITILVAAIGGPCILPKIHNDFKIQRLLEITNYGEDIDRVSDQLNSWAMEYIPSFEWVYLHRIFDMINLRLTDIVHENDRLMNIAHQKGIHAITMFPVELMPLGGMFEPEWPII